MIAIFVFGLKGIKGSLELAAAFFTTCTDYEDVVVMMSKLGLECITIGMFIIGKNHCIKNESPTWKI